MPLVAELVTKLEADTKNFNNRIDGSESKLKKFGKAAAKTGAGIALAIGTVAVGGFIKLLSIINETAENIDKLAKTSRKLGVAVQELQFIQFQAALAGVSTEKLNMGLQRMTRRVSEAGQGTGEAVNALKELNLDAQELAKLSPDKQFAKIGQALAGVSNQADKVRLGFKLFDSEGVDIINAFEGDVKSLRGEFNKLGVALTGPQTKAVENYNDSVTKLGLIWGGFKNQLTVQVAPALEKITTFISEQIIKFGGLGTVANIAARFMVRGLILVVDVVQSVINGIQNIINGFKQAQLTLLNFIQAVDNINFTVFGEDFDFERAEKIARLQRDLAKSQNRGEITAPLQQGLRSVQQSLQPQGQKVEVTIKAEKGFKAEVAESPEVKAKIDEIYRQSIADNASRVGR